MEQNANERSPRSNGGLKATAVAVVLFWVAQFMVLTLVRHLAAPSGEAALLGPRAIVACVGIVISSVIALLFRQLDGKSVTLRVVIAALTAIVGAGAHAAANYNVFLIFMYERATQEATFASYLMAVVDWFWTYCTISALLLVIDYSTELRERDQRMAQLERLAHDSKLKALRYQLQPHFIFNTLNAIASLIAQRDFGGAETMVENLSDFLRATLSLNPDEDVTLQQELELQRLYLDIEAARFPDRLIVETDVPESLRDIRVPSLIIQPLVENALKHAVRRSQTPVTVSVAAEQRDGLLFLTICNSGGDAAPELQRGTGVGLRNVAERMEARFPGRSQFETVSGPDRTFTVRLCMPALRASEP